MTARQALLLIVIIFGSAAQADTTISFSTDQGPDQSSRMEITDHYIRIDANDGKTKAFMLFDATQDRMVFVNDSDQQYLVFDQAQIEQMATMQQQMMAQIDAQLATLPPAQREQMKSMMMQRMGGAMPGGAPKPRRYERGGQQNVGDYQCEVLTVYAGDRKAAEQCVVDRSKLGIPDDDFATMRAMQRFAADIASKFAFMSDQIVEYGEPGRDEVPVRFTHFSRLAGDSTGQLEQISFDPIDASRFQIPSNYKQQEIPQLGR